MILALLLPVLALSAWIIWQGMGRPSWSEFIDRPRCWLLGGHDLTHPIYSTTYPFNGTTYPAVVWRCSRCSIPVIVI